MSRAKITVAGVSLHILDYQPKQYDLVIGNSGGAFLTMYETFACSDSALMARHTEIKVVPKTTVISAALPAALRSLLVNCISQKINKADPNDADHLKLVRLR